MYAVMWSEHCSYKSSRCHLRRLPTEGPARPGRPGGERRGHRRRRRHRRGHPHREPQPPLGHRAVPGGGHRASAGSSATSSPWAPGPSPSWTRCSSARPTDARNRWLAEGVVSGISGYGNSVGRAHRRRRAHFAACYARNPLVNVLCCGALAQGPARARPAPGRGQPGRAARFDDRARRHRRGQRAGLGRLRRRRRRGRRRQAAQRAGGRPLRGEAADRGLPRAARQPLVVGIQDLGGAGLTCATSETAARGGVGMDVDVDAVPAARAGHGALRGHDEREPGAHAGHRHPRRTRRSRQRYAGVGRCGPPSSAGSPADRRALRILDGLGRRSAGRRAGRQPPRGRPPLRPPPAPAGLARWTA